MDIPHVNDQVKARMHTRFPRILEKANMTYLEHQHRGIELCLANELRPTKNKFTKTQENEDILEGFHGGILADDMGMGKTFTMLATIMMNIVRSTLIIVPKCLLDQWNSAIKNITGHFPLMYTTQTKCDISKFEFSNYRITLTSYSTICRSSALKKFKWDRIVCDEAHHINNGKNLIHKVIDALHKRILWLVTGTPVQNRCKELFYLLSLLNQDIVKPKPLIFTHKLPQVIYRKNTQQTVPLNEYTIDIEWDSTNNCEKKIAKSIHKCCPVLNSGPGISDTKIEADPGSCDDIETYHLGRINNPTGNRRGAHLCMFGRGKQSCITPTLLRPMINKVEQSCGKQIDVSNTSSKLSAVSNHIITNITNGKPKIVFCNYLAEIRELRELLIANGVESIQSISGKTSGEAIQDVDVLIIQIQVGSEGLNLQRHYSEIYFVSPQWNPAIERQAIARCHRYGQMNPVNVFRFYMNDICNTPPLDEPTIPEGEECPVCFETALIMKTKCGHCICRTCYDRINNKMCPLCRDDMTIPPEEIPNERVVKSMDNYVKRVQDFKYELYAELNIVFGVDV